MDSLKIKKIALLFFHLYTNKILKMKWLLKHLFYRKITKFQIDKK